MYTNDLPNLQKVCICHLISLHYSHLLLQKTILMKAIALKKVLFIVSLSFIAIVLQGCGATAPATPTQATPPTPIEKPTEKPVEEVVEEVVEVVEEVVEEIADEQDTESTNTTITITTDLGTMEAVLYDSTPLHRDNFVKLVEEGFYDDLLFHRVIEWFMIQGWDPDSRGAAAWVSLGRWGPWYQVDAEIGQPHFKGTLAAARTWWPSNPFKKSSGSQFYIVQGTPVTEAMLTQFEAQKGITYDELDKERYALFGGTPMLDNEYTVFGEVTVWLDVIDTIAATQTAPGDRPVEDVSMSITLK